jgi:hypothetical protein
MTGVLRVSHESMLSGLNNLLVYDVFGDGVYTRDYGLTEGEVGELSALAGFDIAEYRAWYNGYKVNGEPLYNMYSVLSAIAGGRVGAHWTASGAMPRAGAMLDPRRVGVLEELLAGRPARVACDAMVSHAELSGDAPDDAYYSYIAQAGYISVARADPDGPLSTAFEADAAIPNLDVADAWRRMAANARYPDKGRALGAALGLKGDPDAMARALEAFVSDRFSFYDLASSKDERAMNTEAAYHQLLLGMLVMQSEGDRAARAGGAGSPAFPLSNREAGDGRVDICYDRGDAAFVFELKYAERAEDMEAKALEALGQIDSKRYCAEIPLDREVVKIGLALHGKRCAAACAVGRK